MPTANELYQQAKVAGNVSFQAEWGRAQQQLAKLSAGERASQLGFASLEAGEFVMAYDALGQARMRIGHQDDGTVGVIYGNGTPPPVPSAPSVGARQLGIFVGWDGLFAGGYTRPGDFARVDVHLSETAGFVPDGTTIVGTIPEAGGILVGADSVTHYVKLVAVTHSKTADGGGYVASAPTTEVAVLPLPAGQIAAGAIGAQQLAADIAFVSRLVTGNPTGARLELDGRVGVDPGMHLYDNTGIETFRLDASDGDVLMRGTLRTADTGSRIVIRESPGFNDIRFYPQTGSNYSRMLSATAVDTAGVTINGLNVRSPLNAAGNRRSHMWITDNSFLLYRGDNSGTQTYGSLWLGDTFSSLTWSATPSALATGNRGFVINAGGPYMALGDNTSYIGIDTSGLFFTHAQRRAVWTLGDYSWTFGWVNQAGVGIVPLLRVQENSIQFRASGFDFYNGVTGSYLALAASAFIVSSARETKTAIEDLPFDPETVIVDAPAQMWEYRADQTDPDGEPQDATKHLGPMADDLPPELLAPTGITPEGADTAPMGVDLGAQLAVVWAATGQQTSRLNDLEQRLATLETTT